MNTSNKNFDVVFNDDCDRTVKGLARAMSIALITSRHTMVLTKAILPITKVVLLVS